LTTAGPWHLVRRGRNAERHVEHRFRHCRSLCIIIIIIISPAELGLSSVTIRQSVGSGLGLRVHSPLVVLVGFLLKGVLHDSTHVLKHIDQLLGLLQAKTVALLAVHKVVGRPVALARDVAESA